VGGNGLAPGFARHIKLAPHPSSAPAKLNYGVRLEELSRTPAGDMTHARVVGPLPGRLMPRLEKAARALLSKNAEVEKNIELPVTMRNHHR